MHDPSRHRLLIIGDSISLGVEELRISEIAAYVDACYVDLLRKRFDTLDMIVDADIHRTTAAAIHVIDELLTRHRPCLVLLMLGGNDTDVEWKRFIISQGRIVRNRASVPQYASNLEVLTNKILAMGAYPILTDMPNHDLARRGPYLSALSGKDVTAMIAGNGGQEYSDAQLQPFRIAAAEVARKTGSDFSGYGSALHECPPGEVVGRDGVHPNSRAHQIIADQLAPAIASALRKCSEQSISPARAV